ncbi:RNA-binding cell elongation regulator Jag/EloR [Veillonella sp. YH-vei2232]|uniref:RNA-binding protein KhpB n=1 Tax=Veillonella absiana TaxID=3079305 RepID=A0ABU3Z731_9FIRM|nr:MULTISPECIES: RNA-binding cell elongation regulator Jag/EloR [unclassified Veillonella]MDV5063764.1 RNA-binding cell elongation regulator Jag/EloR [Veillonella sp. YH-vei2232]MDV5087727.1 RNA-binding cell elongation regulator Jag/EloR [Veillonella sp. YH-vei2233]
MEFIDVSAKTIEDAIVQGVAQLNSEGRELAETEVITQPSGGFLGIGRKPAVVRLYFTTMAAEASQEEIAEAVIQSNAVEFQPTASIDESATVVVESNASVDADQAADSEEAFDEEAPKAKRSREVSKEDQAEIAEKGKQFLEDMFKQMGLTVFIEKMTTPDKITFQVHGDELGILIGKHGQTLDAIQYLTNLVANKEVAGHCHVVVDVENYRSRREETLVNLAKRLASKVRRNRQKVSLEPMNAFERKIIHTALQGERNIVTDSEGVEPYRHVVISYKR